jgi:hypothetical protein
VIVSSIQKPHNINPDISSRLGVTATADMTVLPGVLGCSFDRLRTGSPCDVLFKYASDPIPRYRGIARGHIPLHGLTTTVHETSGLKELNFAVSYCSNGNFWKMRKS